MPRDFNHERTAELHAASESGLAALRILIALFRGDDDPSPFNCPTPREPNGVTPIRPRNIADVNAVARLLESLGAPETDGSSHHELAMDILRGDRDVFVRVLANSPAHK